MTGIPAGAGQLIGKRLGQYEIVALLALGGTAEIYLARIDGTAGFEKYVVIKCLHDHLADDPDFVKMFLDEARIASSLDHSNIVQTFALGEHQGRYYIAMEFLAGLSLAMIVRRAGERVPGGRIPAPLVLNIALQTAAGLQYAHERVANGAPLNLVHRDVSPQNLVIGFEGVLKVVDFGIARAELRETKTKAGTIKGKFAYMSPEQSVATNIDRRTDVFALGVIVHELLTGKRLFKRNSPYETYQAVIECNVPPPSALDPALDPALDAIVLRAVARDKDQRYPTAEAFADEVADYLHARGFSPSAAELGRFFEQYFQIEIEEHGDRMRELLAGREFSADTGVTWGEDDGKSGPSGVGDGGAALGDDAQLDRLVSRLATESDAQPAGAYEGQAPEKTRIEVNPLELIKEAERSASGRARTTPPKVMQAETAILPDPPAGASNRFAAEQQLPTLIADPRPPPGPPGGPPPGGSMFAVAPGAAPPGSRPASGPPGRSATAPPNATTSAGVSGPPPAEPPRRSRSETKPDLSIAPTAMAAPIDPNKTVPSLDEVLASVAHPAASASNSFPIGPASATHAAIMPPPDLLASSLQTVPAISSLGGDFGATVPSLTAIDDGTPPPQPQAQHTPPPMYVPQQHGQQQQHGPQPMAGPLPIPAPPSQQLQLDPTGSPYPVVHGGRPFSTDLAPSAPMHRGSARVITPGGTAIHGNAGNAANASGAFPPNGAQGANMMSPVGDNYGNNVDWPAEAARRARALKPWQLGLLFVGVLGLALLLTLVIAKIAH